MLFSILVFAKPILIPLGIALLISFILLPLAKKFEKWKIGKTLAAFLQDKIISAFADITLFINNHLSFMEHLGKGELFNRLKFGLLIQTNCTNHWREKYKRV